MKYLLVFIIFFNSLLYSQKIENTDSIAYYSTLADTSIKDNDYKNALFYTQKAINYSVENNQIDSQGIQTYKLGKIYFAVKKYDDAKEAFSESISLLENLKSSATYADLYYYLGLTNIRKKKPKAAEICFDKAQEINSELQIPGFNELIILQQGIIHKSKGHYELASEIFSGIIATTDSPEVLDTKAEAMYQIGQIEEINKRNNLALNYYNKALSLNEKNKNLEQKSNILFALSSVYDKMLDKSLAYSYLKQHLNLKESISILNNEKLGIDDYESFKESQRLKKIEQLNKQNIEKAKTNKFSKLINILAIALISILSLLSLSLYKNNIIRKKSNLLLRDKNNELIIAKEKAEKASKARSEFLSTVSHELRTPLNAINGITHLLLEENPKKSQLHYLSSLKFSGNYLTTFINEILEINKIESNKTELENINFNLRELLKDIQNSLKGIALKNNDVFTLNIDPNTPEYLLGDPTKLSQIFLNLINNALKFTKDGNVTTSVKLLSLENGKATLSFAITDTGIGIPKDKLATVFESFSQGSVEINRKYGGTGLGLTIVKKLIELLGGEVKLESIEGLGSTFSFALKFEVNELPLDNEEKQKPYDESILKDKKILIVEDNKINQMITKKMLENKGIVCEIIDNGEDAIKVAKSNTYDLILMDVHLPGINGTIATEQIREFDSITPIIAITAISLDENREMLLSYGMNDVITKPFPPAEFYTVITQNIKKANTLKSTL
ncbi:tetratricopeptide repeat-containing hybrid sensor histidine kinase/response regulator [Flavobacterium degerlachei]|jgi:signal transduction histidine kinase/CheY-like chemotaxis protein/HEPN domain-containing protein|uniref:histidine kinase n=1 Tax=Flavobacterium degerlachei TaxID=229203 RepID=A0A1H2W642_9FLAO|nr:ATP-binding protein [Flavobacterium degerlachei]SDW75997.1 Tetratricopeptide repeat-containing protein [Flavobacterium degerlachei]